MTLIEVEVVKAVRAPITPVFVRRVLERAAHVPEVAARIPDPRSTVAVRITDDDELERLNRAFAGEDHPTDVLSFNGTEGHLGDIAISWPAVVRQSERYGHGVESELGLLAVHGLLHLLGWDHPSAAEGKEMTRLTVVALAASHLPLSSGRL